MKFLSATNMNRRSSSGKSTINVTGLNYTNQSAILGKVIDF